MGVDRYFGQFHPTRHHRWVFGNRDSGAYLHRFAWTPIVRHDLVKGAASPDDPAMTAYWAARRRAQALPPINPTTLRLLNRQHGRCSICGGLLLHADHQPTSPHEWEQWLRGTGRAITKQAIVHHRHGPPNDEEQHLAHADCYRRVCRRQQPPSSPAGL